MINPILPTHALLEAAAFVRLLQRLAGGGAEVGLERVSCSHPIEDVLGHRALGVGARAQGLDDDLLVTRQLVRCPISTASATAGCGARRGNRKGLGGLAGMGGVGCAGGEGRVRGVRVGVGGGGGAVIGGVRVGRRGRGEAVRSEGKIHCYGERGRRRRRGG